ncbi:MAG: DNA-processing protein DprA, partial [Candidatus Altiarchaeota archaeon]
STICVLGSGFFNYFPVEHTEVFNEISKKGLLVSEHPPEFKGTAISLASRNRITSGISDSVLVVTSQNKGGALRQMEIANDQKIPIFAPKLEYNMAPNEGIRNHMVKYRIQEVDGIKPILNEIARLKPFFLQAKI